MLRNKFSSVVLVAAVLLGTLTTVFAQDDNTLVVWADETRAPILQEFAADIEAELGIALDVVQLELGSIRDQLLVAGPVGEGPDVLINPHDVTGQLVENGAILPIELGDDQSAEFLGSALDLFTYEDQLWAVPYAIENIALIRNVDLVPEAPATWEEVRALAEEFAANADEGPDYAFVVQTGNTYHNFPITSAFGGYIFGVADDGTFDVADIGLNSDGGIAAASWLSGMYSDGLMPVDVNDDVVFDFFEDGEAAMFVTGPWFSQRIVDTGVNYSIDPLPGSEMGMDVGAPFAGGQGFMISAFSEKQLLAEVFLLDFVATPDFMQALFDADPRPAAHLAVDTSIDPNIESYIAAGSNAIPMPAIPEMSAVWASSDAALNLVSQGEDAAESFNNAVSQISDAIGLLNSDERIIGLAGSFQAALGCDSDWMPSCEITFLTDEGDGIFTGTFTIPAGEYAYKIAVNGAWDENYGVDGEAGGADIVLTLEEDTEVTFTYDDSTNVVTTNLDG